MPATFPPETMRFLAALKKNNRREWFEEHKQDYLAHVKEPLERFCVELAARITRWAPAYATEPKRAIFRIYRDTRFSPDKTPYKTHASAYFYRSDLPKGDSAGFYVHIEPGHCASGGGLYSAQPETLLAVRLHLLEHHQRFRALVKKAGELKGESLSRPPKGFPPAHAGLDLVKGRQWYFYEDLEMSPKFLDAVDKCFRKYLPVVEFLNEPLLGLQKKRKQVRLDG